MNITSNDKFSIQSLQNICNISQTISGKNYIQELVRNISNILDIKYILIGRPKEENQLIIKTDFAWAKDQFIDNFEYELKGTPCENVITGHRICIHKKDVFSDFPDDLLLRDMNVEAYIGAPITLPDGTLLGLLVLLDIKEFEHPNFLEAAIDIFASRIGLEIAREEADRKILNLNVELERKVKENIHILNETQKSLVEQERFAALGRVLAGISHEIRNPLNLIMNSGKIAAKELKKILNNHANIEKQDEKDYKILSESINLVNVHSERIKTILKLMMDISGNTDEKEEFNVFELINSSINYAHHAFRAQTPNFNISIHKNFPTNKIMFPLSKDIQSVFLNLIENAMFELYKKHNKDETQARLNVSFLTKDESLIIEIEDNGRGIPRDVVDHIFEPFYTTKSPTEGSGLGLAISKNIIDKNNGTIKIETKENEYTKFILSFSK